VLAQNLFHTLPPGCTIALENVSDYIAPENIPPTEPPKKIYTDIKLLLKQQNLEFDLHCP
jgi:hypothetical protein